MGRQRLFRACLGTCLGICMVLLCAFSTAAPANALGGPQIPIGDPAPDFSLAANAPANTEDGKVSLHDYRGQWVVLYFYPQDFTSGCTLEAQRFQQDIAEYQSRDVQILGVSADDVDSHADFCDSEGLVFPLLSDPDGAVSKAYGSWLGYRSLRHTYIIDPQGAIAARFLGVRPVIHSQEVLATLDQLQAG